MYLVYELWNPLDNTCFYVGKSSGKRSRFPDHLRQARNLREGKHLGDHNPIKAGTICKIQDAGFDPEYRVAFECENEQDALDFEVKLIAKYGRRNTGTGILSNMTDGGEGIRGWKLSDEARSKRVSSMKGRKLSEETKSKMRLAALGRKHSEETKQKIAEVQRGRVQDRVSVEKRRLANIGKKMSEEAKKKISIAKMGKPLSEEHKKRVSEGRKGKPWSEARRAAQKGSA